jgi:hypothetical protein
LKIETKQNQLGNGSDLLRFPTTTVSVQINHEPDLGTVLPSQERDFLLGRLLPPAMHDQYFCHFPKESFSDDSLILFFDLATRHGLRVKKHLVLSFSA